jgi:hypothetical protein
MDFLEPASLRVLGGFLLLAGLFVLRELVSGALKEAGRDLWIWARHRARSQPARSKPIACAGTGEHSETDRRRSAHNDPSMDDDWSSYLLRLRRDEADIAATGQHALRSDAPPEPRRKSASAGGYVERGCRGMG